MKRLLLLIVGAVGCGGSSNPDMAQALADLSVGGGDLGAASCTPATNGFYVLTGLGSQLAKISPDPNGWDDVTPVNLVDSAGKTVTGIFMTVLPDENTFYLNGNLGMYEGSLSSIQNGKLTLTSNGFITGGVGTTGSKSGPIAPGGGVGDLILEFGDISAHIALMHSGGGSSTITSVSGNQVSANCQLIDFEGTVNGDNYSLDGICRTEVDHLDNGLPTATLSTGTTLVFPAGLRRYQGTIYVVDKNGNLYDETLTLIKKQKPCLAGVPSRGVSVLSL